MCSPSDPPSEAELAYLGMKPADRRAWALETLHTWMRARFTPERYEKWCADVKQARIEEEASGRGQRYRQF